MARKSRVLFISIVVVLFIAQFLGSVPINAATTGGGPTVLFWRVGWATGSPTNTHDTILEFRSNPTSQVEQSVYYNISGTGSSVVRSIGNEWTKALYSGDPSSMWKASSFQLQIPGANASFAGSNWNHNVCPVGPTFTLQREGDVGSPFKLLVVNTTGQSFMLKDNLDGWVQLYADEWWNSNSSTYRGEVGLYSAMTGQSEQLCASIWWRTSQTTSIPTPSPTSTPTNTPIPTSVPAPVVTGVEFNSGSVVVNGRNFRPAGVPESSLILWGYDLTNNEVYILTTGFREHSSWADTEIRFSPPQRMQHEGWVMTQINGVLSGWFYYSLPDASPATSTPTPTATPAQTPTPTLSPASTATPTIIPEPAITGTRTEGYLLQILGENFGTRPEQQMSLMVFRFREGEPALILPATSEAIVRWNSDMIVISPPVSMPAHGEIQVRLGDRMSNAAQYELPWFYTPTPTPTPTRTTVRSGSEWVFPTHSILYLPNVGR